MGPGPFSCTAPQVPCQPSSSGCVARSATSSLVPTSALSHALGFNRALQIGRPENDVSFGVQPYPERLFDFSVQRE